jgi:hypothetical protein
MTSRISVFLLATAVILSASQAQDKKALEKLQRALSLGKETAIFDRGGGTHNKSNIGHFFENRGKLYPRTAAQGPSGEWPIGSGREYIYRANIFFGRPNNVVQGRYTTDEEWEAAAGYTNRDSAKIAFSDKPGTWPKTGWPVVDAAGKPVFVSDQDSYCVYNDSNNTKSVMGLEVRQTGYAFSLKLVKDMIFFKFTVVNRSNRAYDSLYLGLYLDCDIGDVSGGVAEYADDKVGFDKALQLWYFYDDGVSSEWPGVPTGYFGWTLLQTPRVGGVERGITDWHYSLYDDDLDRDTVQYGIMSSTQSLYSSATGARYFHPGANLPNIHYDDPATLPPAGADLVSMAGSGPYTLAAGDSLTFVTAFVPGTTLADIKANAQRAYDLMNAGFASPQPPPAPKVTVTPGDRNVLVRWDARAEDARDRLTGKADFEGYKLYKSTDKGQHWDQIDRNLQPGTGADPVPLSVFDRVDGIGPDNGLQYSYVDTAVVNGFEYWYSVTAFDQGDSLVASLENARGNTADEINLGIAIPRTSAAGRFPVGTLAASQSGTGASNIKITIAPSDVPEAASKAHVIRFAPVASIERGNLRTLISVTQDSVLASSGHTFALVFTSPSLFRIRDLTAKTILSPAVPYVSAGTIGVVGGLRVTMSDTAAFPDQRPEAGDSIVIRPGLAMSASGTEVMPLRPFAYGIRYATSNGVVVTFAPPEPVKSIIQKAGTKIVTVQGGVTAPDSVTDDVYQLTFTTTYPDAGNTKTYANAVVRNGANAIVAQKDSLLSGGTLRIPGITLTVIFASADPGTRVDIETAKPRAVTYQDAFTFTTTGPTSDAGLESNLLERIKVVPNPYLIGSAYEQEYGALRREPIRALKFNNLPAKCTIYIFTMAGDKVKTIDHESTNGTETWDLKGAGGREIAPGVYIYIVKTATAERISRFAVIK